MQKLLMNNDSKKNKGYSSYIIAYRIIEAFYEIIPTFHRSFWFAATIHHSRNRKASTIFLCKPSPKKIYHFMADRSYLFVFSCVPLRTHIRNIREWCGLRCCNITKVQAVRRWKKAHVRSMIKNLEALMVALKCSAGIFVVRFYDDMSKKNSDALARSASAYLQVPWRHVGVVCLQKEVLLVDFLVHASWSVTL